MIPNPRSINMIIKAWLKIADEESMERAERLLTLAEDLGLATVRGCNLYLSAVEATPSFYRWFRHDEELRSSEFRALVLRAQILLQIVL
mmetsp:Transcript_19976/g.40666  ORF Transcript_19976/g.40666 Transcript_19976/m.40666 type:complete len:89 (-) Transcript_19976:628-894(-)